MNLTLSLYLLSLCLCIFGRLEWCDQNEYDQIRYYEKIVSMDVDDPEKLNCLEMRKHEWYKGTMGRRAAEDLLLARLADKYVQPNGAFLVRECFPGEYSLSVKFGDTVEHMRILRDGASKYFLWVVKFNSVLQLITYHRTSSASRNKRLYLTDMVEMDLEATLEGEKRYIANHDFMPRACDELLIKQGDEIIVAKHVDYDSGWLEGMKCRTYQVGMFPRQYVDQVGMFPRQQIVLNGYIPVLKSVIPEMSKKGYKKRYIALYDFGPQECDELLLKMGDEITIINDDDPFWWKGIKCRTYQVGFFPREYVDELKIKTK